MAIGPGSLISVSTAGKIFSQSIMNVYTYRVTGSFGSPDASQWGEAWWNAIKDELRACVSVRNDAAFQSVIVREMDNALGAYGEFSVPTGERAGLNGSGSDQILPVFTAAGIRLTVGSRLTRPGQKRIAGQHEGNLEDGVWNSTYLALLNTLGHAISSSIVLGAPALGAEIVPVVVSRDPVTGLPVNSQDVTGFIVNPLATSQVSRKVGRGA